jgi:hypothetical protein
MLNADGSTESGSLIDEIVHEGARCENGVLVEREEAAA